MAEDRSKPWATDEDVPDGEFFDEAFEAWQQYGKHEALWALPDRITAGLDLHAEVVNLRQRLADLQAERQAMISTLAFVGQLAKQAVSKAVGHG